MNDSCMIHRGGPTGTILLALSLGACVSGGGPDNETSEEPSNHLVAVARTNSLQWEGEQAYITLYADGTASGLVVVNLNGGLLYGTSIPDSWTWLDEDTVEICTSVNILRNEVDFPPMERDCGTYPITGKELDQNDDGDIDLIETFTVTDTLFFRGRPLD